MKENDAVAQTVEVTPEMEAAGLLVLAESGLVDDLIGADTLLVADIYRAMFAASLRPNQAPDPDA